MKTFNNFNEMFANNSNKNKSVFNTIYASADNGDCSCVASWNYGSNTVWFSVVDKETGAINDYPYGCNFEDQEVFDTDMELNSVMAEFDSYDLGEIRDEVASGIFDLFEASEYDDIIEFTQDNEEQVSNVITSVLRSYNLKPYEGLKPIEVCGLDGIWDDGGYSLSPDNLDIGLDYTSVEPIDKDMFEKNNYAELSKRLASFCNGIEVNYNAMLSQGYGNAEGLGHFEPCTDPWDY